MPVIANTTLGQVELDQLRSVQQGSAEWHSARRSRLTASDVTKVLGCCPYGDETTLIEEKTKQWCHAPSAATAAQQRGIDQEPQVAQWFVDNFSSTGTGTAVAQCLTTGLWVHPTEQWLAASPDRLVHTADGKKFLLEIKCLKEVPHDLQFIITQVQTQLHVLEACSWFPAGQDPAAFVCIKTHDGQHHTFAVVLDVVAKFTWQTTLQKLRQYYKHYLVPVVNAKNDSAADKAHAAVAVAAVTAPSVSAACTNTATPRKQQQPSSPVAADNTPSIKPGKPVLHTRKKELVGTVLAAAVDGRAKVKWHGGERAKHIACTDLRVQPLNAATQQKYPTAEKQRVLVTNGEYAGQQGIVVKLGGMRCKVQLDEGLTTSITVCNLHTHTHEDQDNATEPQEGSEVCLRRELEHQHLQQPGDFEVLLDRLTENADLLKKGKSWATIRATLEAIVAASHELTGTSSVPRAAAAAVAAAAPGPGAAAPTPSVASIPLSGTAIGQPAARSAASAAAAAMGDGDSSERYAGEGPCRSRCSGGNKTEGPFVDVPSIKAKVQQGLGTEKGKCVYSVSFGCARAAPSKPSTRPDHKVARPSKKVGCRYHLRIEFWQHPQHLVMLPIEFASHNNHQPGSLEDGVDLEMDPQLADRCMALLRLGMRPFEVLLQLDREVDEKDDADYINSFSGRGRRLSWRDVRNLAKRVAREKMIDSNDVAAVTSMIAELEKLPTEINPVLYYQKQTLTADKQIDQHFILVLGTQFSKRMLAFAAGNQRMALMDATGGILYCGYQLYTVAVVDDYREGVPCLFMITSDQEATAVETLLRVAKDSIAPLQLNNVMIDKSFTEIAAINSQGCFWLLCLFHMLQERERWLRSSDSSVRSDDRDAVLADLKALAVERDREIFLRKELGFLQKWGHYLTIQTKYTKDWQSCADHWAFYGRAELWGMDTNTNNHLERWIGIFKYIFLHGKKLAQLAQLIKVLLTEVLPHYEKDRLKKVIGIEHSSSQEVVDRQRREVEHLVQKQWVQLVPGPAACGLFTCRSLDAKKPGVIYQGCLAALACSCQFEGICKHLQAAAQIAAAQQQPFSHNMRMQAAAQFLQMGALQQLDPTCGICYGRPLWDITSTEALVMLNISTGYCSCLDFRHHSVCAHLLAADQHPALAVHRQQNSVPFVAEDPAAAIGVMRTIVAPQLPEVVEEPAECLKRGNQQQFKQIAAAISRARSQCAAPKLSEEQKELGNVGRGILTCSKYADAAVCAELLPAAKELLQKLKAAAPAFKEVNVRAGDVGRRKSTDRTHKSLLSRSKRSKASAAAEASDTAQPQQQQSSSNTSIKTAVKKAVKAAVNRKRTAAGSDATRQQQEQQKFAKIKEGGAPKRTFRGLGSMTTRARKTTGPRRVPRTQQKTATDAATADAAVQQGLAQQTKGRKRKADAQTGRTGHKKPASGVL